MYSYKLVTHDLKCVVELQGKEHAIKLREALVEKGYDPVWDDESAKNMI